MAIANTIFRFDFKFGVNVNGNSLESSFQHGNVDITTTTSPILANIWSKQVELNSAANSKVKATQVAVSQLYNEISSVVGSSDFLAAKVKLMSRYLNYLNVSTLNKSSEDYNAGSSAAAKRFEILQDYVQLVDDLRAPPTNEEESERSLDYLVMKLSLEKHKLVELQTEIVKDVLMAVDTWQTFTKKQIISVITV